MDDPDWFMSFEMPSSSAIKVPVLRVFDGDGFLTRLPHGLLTGNERDHSEVEIGVRLGFIDAPELDQRGGREAGEFLTALIGGRSVWICILTKMDTGKSVDRHGRLVAVAYVGDEYPASMFRDRMNAADYEKVRNRSLYLPRNVEMEMLLNGWAWVVEKYGPDQKYLEALKIAQTNKRGIWARHDNIPPWNFKRQKYAERHRSRRLL